MRSSPLKEPLTQRFLLPIEATALWNSVSLAVLPPGSCPPPHNALPSPFLFPTIGSLLLSPSVQRLSILLTPYLLISFSLPQVPSLSINGFTRSVSFLYTDCSIQTNFLHLSEYMDSTTNNLNNKNKNINPSYTFILTLLYSEQCVFTKYILSFGSKLTNALTRQAGL